MFTCGAEAADARQQLFQIPRELVLIEEFLVFVVRFSEKVYCPVIFLKEVDNLVVLRHRLQACAISARCGFDRIRGEELTRWMVSRIPFASWNTVAARPIAAVAVPNASAAIVGERKRSWWV
jgi:hypothetical protein